ncbi:PREDICTED: putative leucine-rich repeat receptor-like serine/threonine-protein kinase At2g24130 [Nelumbo nucifera]|uniref:non-specific serine/threonine protein kinase n=2 Tax=Nelumbo nucifera TaxID=4432 RepID=A0A1U8AZJ2_NELNU|nr:PREDICTED: putative leucine-rich repeat receptor-like serine/threonine-protein kinase At2g24130 [Nelumbo nucifera]DAD45365.1 TPA_asm: hypothetical protein HUJ06_003595 [Nelumbo nucifera]
MSFCTFARSSFLCLVILFPVVYGEDNARSLNDRAALLSFMSGIDSDPEKVLGSWSSSGLHICNWTGVTCNSARDQVVKLDLGRRSLEGTISVELSNLSSLSVLDLSENFFRGSIPAELGALSMLTHLNLTYNVLEGNIPAEIGFLSHLEYLDLSSNRLVGQIPESLFCNGSSSLSNIDLSENSLTGKIPLWNHCKLIGLKRLQLWSNWLVGPIPQALANSTKLKWLDVTSNSLSGELPAATVDKTPQLQYLYLSYTNLISQNGNTDLEPFFVSLVNCSNLQTLELAGNNLGGQLPSVIGNLSTTFAVLHLEENLLSGSIPPSISNLVNFTFLNLSSNLFNGSIPPELSRIGGLERICLSNNSLTGEIPSALGNISHLGLLDLSRNKLLGSIPDSFSNLSQLRRLMLYENNLSGTIPPSLGKCTNLEILDLSHNKISGMIPIEVVAGWSSLTLYLNLSSNLLQGPLPLELSKMNMILAIDLSSNNLSGAIPPQLGSCIALEYLNLSGNSLQGPLPLPIGRLFYLRVLDLSSNHLVGEIPESLQASPTLTELNLSFNNFSGSITKDGAFATLTIDSFQGNSGLCGSIPGMTTCWKKRKHHLVILQILLLLFLTPTLCFFVYRLRNKSKRRHLAASFGAGELSKDEQERKQLEYPRISYQQLIEATNGFNSSSLIGSGRLGHVYKGTLKGNRRIAVKVFDPGMGVEICTSFKRECQVLKRTRHRNLIRVITACSSPEFKALVFPLMPNGSLETHLYPSHSSGPNLSLAQLVSICSDVAEGVAYLHHHCPVRVVHCDLKPSNILLDEDMTALVTDFGIARLVKGGGEDEAITRTIDSLSTMDSTAGLLYGSFGYIAPEYGMGKRSSTKGDIYSFGVLILEILTGKRPTDVMFHQGSSLHEWVKRRYSDDLEPIMEEALLRFAPPPTPRNHSSNAWKQIILELIELGLICTQNSPSMRPSTLDVALEIDRLKQYLANPTTLTLEDVSC